MAPKMYQALVGLFAFLSIASIASTAPVLDSTQPALAHGNLGHVLTYSISQDHVRRAIGQRRAAPLTAPPGGPQWTVQAGDTGNQIAAQLGIKFFQLAFLNPTVHWRFLQIGQTLNIPGDGSGSHMHVVVAGDTGNAIAAANNITFTQLDAFNRNINWYNLQIGQSLVIPSPAMDVTRLSQLPDVVQADQDADVPAPASASGLDLPVAPVVDSDSDVEVTTSTKETSPLLTPGETPSPSDSFSSRTLKVRQFSNMRPAAPQVSASTSANTAYTVKAGDTGYSIAAQLGVNFDALDKANPGIKWVYLQVGQNINVPAGTSVSGAATVSPVPQVNKQVTGGYVTYQGAVSTAQPPYPLMSSWIPFAQLWTMNSGNIGTTCVFSSGSVPPNTNNETASLRSAIQSVSDDTNVNPSFILAITLQESNGCVRVPTTSSWENIQNPGLMQSFNGRASCNSKGRMQQPCPDYLIKAMIADGVKGSQNVGIMSALKSGATQIGSQWPLAGSADVNANGNVNPTGNTLVQGSNTNTQVSAKGGVSTGMGAPSVKQTDGAILYYQAARIYNSGSLSADGDLSSPTRSTRCYVSDVVNRLLGWTGPRSCSLS